MSDNNRNLGRMEKVALRDAWQSEAGDFTPWLAEKENLELLSDELEMDLQLEGTEQNVGQYRADIVCKDLYNDQWVLIENQLQRTDHSHLGQLITYAAGLEAASIVWIAESFIEHHRAALDWLNEMMGDSVNCFGLEIELWRIDKSRTAPKFNVVSKPNSWTKRSRGSKPITRPGRLEYWTAFHEYLKDHAPDIKPARASDGASLDVAAPWEGIRFKVGGYDDQGRLFVRLAGRRDVSVPVIERLFKDKAAVEAEFGGSVFEKGKLGRPNVQVNRSGTAALDDNSEKDFAWFVETIRKLTKVLGGRISDIFANS